MNWKTYMKSLAAIAVGGAIAGVTATLSSGNITPKALGTSVVTGALVALGGYLKQSPISPGPLPEPQHRAYDPRRYD